MNSISPSWEETVSIPCLAPGANNQAGERKGSPQSILRQKREVTLLLVEGLVGKNFAKTLSFYLDHHQEYLDALNHIERRLRG